VTLGAPPRQADGSLDLVLFSLRVTSSTFRWLGRQPQGRVHSCQHSANRLWVAEHRGHRIERPGSVETALQRSTAEIRPPSQGGSTGSNPFGTATWP